MALNVTVGFSEHTKMFDCEVLNAKTVAPARASEASYQLLTELSFGNRPGLQFGHGHYQHQVPLHAV